MYMPTMCSPGYVYVYIYMYVYILYVDICKLVDIYTCMGDMRYGREVPMMTTSKVENMFNINAVVLPCICICIYIYVYICIRWRDQRYGREAPMKIDDDDCFYYFQK